MTTVCHRPEGLEQMEAQTNFTKRELQVLYRGFKNVRTKGLMVVLPLAFEVTSIWFSILNNEQSLKFFKAVGIIF